jgi:phasin
MANAPKRSAVPLAIPAPAPVEAAVATVKAVLKSEPQLAATPAAEIQQSFRTALEKGVVESRAAFAKAKSAADETANAFEISFAAAKDGALAINAKALEAMRTNADANFDFWKAMFSVKSLPDLISLQTEFARKQVETITSQTKDFGAMTRKAMADAVEPIKEQAARSFKLAV